MINHTRTASAGQARERRTTNRQAVNVPGRLVWKDARGTTRFATVVTRDVSEGWAFVECVSGTPIPLYRLVQLQLDRSAADDSLPAALRQHRILSAVYRVGASKPSTGLPDGYALRLLVDPARVRPAATGDTEETEAYAAAV